VVGPSVVNWGDHRLVFYVILWSIGLNRVS
jgi:hypothetical protein